MSIQSSKGLYAALPLSVCRTPPHPCPAFRSNWRTIARKRKGHKSGNDRFAPIAVIGLAAFRKGGWGGPYDPIPLPSRGSCIWPPSVVRPQKVRGLSTSAVRPEVTRRRVVDDNDRRNELRPSAVSNSSSTKLNSSANNQPHSLQGRQDWSESRPAPVSAPRSAPRSPFPIRKDAPPRRLPTQCRLDRRGRARSSRRSRRHPVQAPDGSSRPANLEGQYA